MVIASLDKVLERILLTSILPSKSENLKKNPRIRGGELGMVPLIYMHNLVYHIQYLTFKLKDFNIDLFADYKTKLLIT